ncbi:MAG: DUF1329 domain-containing protein, partial [Stutzerimonas stutzeri]
MCGGRQRHPRHHPEPLPAHIATPITWRRFGCATGNQDSEPQDEIMKTTMFTTGALT